jgi:transaldolase
MSAAASPLRATVATATEFWNDSCDATDLAWAIERGATGATANPTIVHDVWRRDPARWRERARRLAREDPSLTEDEIAWRIVEEMSLHAAKLLEPVFAASGGRSGRLSIQTNPTFWPSTERMLEQGTHFSGLAPNIIVKFPATRAGIVAMEEATYRGVSVNATVSFTVAQALAAAEAIERGLQRREREGQSTSDMGPVVTIMVGRLEDWLRVQTERDGIVVHPWALPWSGIAVFKRAYRIFRERGYRARLLAAAIRHHLHWTEFVGGACIITLPPVWQRRFEASGIEPSERMHEPVDASIIEALRQRFPDFVRAYEPDGLALSEFDAYPPTIRTLRQFIGSYHDLLHEVTNAVLPNPDLASS